MKVGILTFSAAHNFGAVLQCYGLFKSIESMGHDVEVIDYRPKYLATYEPKFGWRQVVSRHLLSLPARIKTYSYWRGIYDRYINFKSGNMKQTEPIETVDQFCKVASKFDMIVVGSDQVWNPGFNGGDKVWYGAVPVDVKWVTYAASAGNIERWMSDAACLPELLSNFQAISVREPELAEAVHNLSPDIDLPPTVLDPSLLGNDRIWDRWKKPVEKKDYILTYQARESDDVFRIAEALKDQLNCKEIIPIDFYENVNRHHYKTRVASPEDFISLVANARCVVTTSFHGTAFSIILETPFYTLKLDDGADGRAENLLKNVGLEDRLIRHNSTPEFAAIDFSSAKRELGKMRGESMDYLSKVFS